MGGQYVGLRHSEYCGVLGKLEISVNPNHEFHNTQEMIAFRALTLPTMIKTANARQGRADVLFDGVSGQIIVCEAMHGLGDLRFSVKKTIEGEWLLEDKNTIMMSYGDLGSSYPKELEQLWADAEKREMPRAVEDELVKSLAAKGPGWEYFMDEDNTKTVMLPWGINSYYDLKYGTIHCNLLDQKTWSDSHANHHNIKDRRRDMTKVFYQPVPMFTLVAPNQDGRKKIKEPSKQMTDSMDKMQRLMDTLREEIGDEAYEAFISEDQDLPFMHQPLVEQAAKKQCNVCKAPTANVCSVCVLFDGPYRGPRFCSKQCEAKGKKQHATGTQFELDLIKRRGYLEKKDYLSSQDKHVWKKFPISAHAHAFD